MKYTDRNTMVLSSKYSDKEVQYDSNNRRARREAERNLLGFNRLVYRYIEKEYWDSVDLKDRKFIYNNWSNYFYINKMSNFESFIKNELFYTKIDKAKYRDKRINKILS